MRRMRSLLLSMIGAGLGAQLAACTGDTVSSPAVAPVGRVVAAEGACTGYTVTDLGALEGSVQASSAAAVAPGGAVAGTAHPTGSFATFQAYRWTAADGLTGLGSLGGSSIE